MTTMPTQASSKVMPLEDAVRRFVQPGDAVHVAYSEARPNAALLALARAFAGSTPQLTLVTSGMVSVQHALVELGIVERVVASFIGENFPAARPNRAFQRALAEGRVEVSNWSMLALIQRLMAGALGVPYLPTRSMIGSSMFDDLPSSDIALVPDPFGGPCVPVVSALNPDIVLLHGVAADTHGNIVLSGPYGEAHWGCLAAKRGVIATVERIVDDAEILHHNALVRVPAHLVRAVCEVPLGSHPYGLFDPGMGGIEEYVEDLDFVEGVFAASKTTETFRAWIDEWVLGVADHTEYLDKLGASRVEKLKAQALSPVPAPERTVDDGWSPTEFQVVAASRAVHRRVLEGGFDAVLAGVGLANLAAWGAEHKVREDGGTFSLLAELGMYGYRPKPGDPFIFAHQNLSTCQMLTDVPTVLGAMVGGPSTRTLGVLGAGQVDEQGNTNSTFDDDRRFIVGSGGANDVASGADEVLLTVSHRRSRLPSSLPFITCPGTNVRMVVTSCAVFERRDDRFVVIRYLPGAPGQTREEALAAIRDECGWDYDVAEDVEAEADPTAAELSLLREFDPHRTFLR